jgi:hypothetical protein
LIKRNTVLYIVDIFLLVLICISFITGLIKFPGLFRFLGDYYFSIPFHFVSVFHDWSGLFMGILIFIHLILHWKWMVQMTRKIVLRRK